MQWTLIHHCCARSEHYRGMPDVLKSLLQVCPIELVDQKTGGGTPTGWSALSLLCNARDAANTRLEMVSMLLERKANMEASNPQGSTPLIHACASGFWSVVRLLLDAKADHNAAKKGGRNALDVTPNDQTQAPLGSIGFLVTMSPATSQV
ncbi:MAG: ankyrin repeat domain-containing protein [Chloroflexota bacterium]|nr:ankyrin repeat domain-containing protein [Chloroflexota bacterium]